MDQNGSKTKITKDKNNKLEDSKQRGGGRAGRSCDEHPKDDEASSDRMASLHPVWAL
jgi:hypothetical protein